MRRSDSGVRILFFLSVFCISGLVAYFTLGHIYGYGDGGVVQKPKSTIDSNQIISRLYPRSEDDYEFLIIVFGWRRKDSLKRLMKSLLAADYLNQRVRVQFHIEFEPSEGVREFVETLQWPYGNKSIIWRKESFGLERMVVNSWNATDDKEFAFFFEDDIEVHPQFFKFTLAALKQAEIGNNFDLVGIALNTPRYDEINLQHSIWGPARVLGSEAELFYFQLPCSWGALYFPWKWREFLNHYHKRHRPNMRGLEVVPITFVKQWKQSWKKFYIELMVLKGYVMLYPSLPRQESLSVHHREEGVHTGKIRGFYKVVDYFVCPFATSEQVEKLIQALGNVSKLPVLNFYHLPSNMTALKQFGKMVFDRMNKHH